MNCASPSSSTTSTGAPPGLPSPRRPALVHRGRTPDDGPLAPAIAARAAPRRPRAATLRRPTEPSTTVRGSSLRRARRVGVGFGCRGTLDAELIEDPEPIPPSESKTVQAIAARARAIPCRNRPTRTGRPGPGPHPLRRLAAALRHPAQRGHRGRTAVIIHPAAPQDVASGDRPRLRTDRAGVPGRHAMRTRPSDEGDACALRYRGTPCGPPQVDFDKTGVRSRGELVGQIFLDHYATRWQAPATTTPGLLVRGVSPDLRRCP